MALVAGILVSDGRWGACSFDLAPRKPCELARRREKAMRRLSQLMASAYWHLRFVASNCASLFMHLSVMTPQPPLLEKTSGTKEPCSTSRTRSAYLATFLCSWNSYAEARGLAAFDWAKALKTHTSKYALSNLPPHTPPATISTLALGSVEVEACWNVLSSTGVSTGSTATELPASVITSASRSRVSLWRCVGKLPSWHVRAWDTV